MEKYQLTSKFKGYVERDDVTNIDPNYLILGSANVISTDGKRVGNRKGYTRYGQISTGDFPIVSSFDWPSRQQGARYLRVYEDATNVRLQTLDSSDSTDVQWRTIMSSLTQPEVNFDTFWDTTEESEVALFVAGDKNIYVYSGGQTTYASSTTTTITKEGTTTWAEEGFFLSGTRQITIGATTYTYTGGEGSTTLTGVTPDPTSGGHVAGDFVFQTIRTSSNAPVATATKTASTIAFVNSNPDTITDSGNGFVTAGFVAGDIITVSGTVNNNKTYTAQTVVAGTITLVSTDAVTAEGAGSSFTLTAYRPWTNDNIAVLRNQVYISSNTSRQVFVSAVGDYDNFTAPAVPRLVGESALLQFDSVPRAFKVQEENMYVSGSLGDWYQVTFDLSADLSSEQITVKRLKTGPQQSAQNQSSVFKMKNDILFISDEPTLDSLGRVENINTPTSKPISDPVNNLFGRLDFTDCSGVYFQDNIYIAVPVESLVLVYNLIESHWESPLVLPIQRFAIIDGELYGHSNGVNETYKLFDGWNDNGNPIHAIAQFAYQQFGNRAVKKIHTDWYTEGYIEANTELTLQLLYEYEGSRAVRDFTINSEVAQTIFTPITDGSLGKLNIGYGNLGGSVETDGDSLPPKFRVINQTQSNQKYFEISPIYSSNSSDYRWEILAFGPKAIEAPDANPEIKL